MDPFEFARYIKSHAKDLGFDLVGITSAIPPPHAGAFDEWTAKGFAGGMDYLTRQRTSRMDPSSLLPGVRSVICCAISYRPAPQQWPLVGEHPVSCYAWGRDYHRVLKEKLEALASSIRERDPATRTRCYVDSSPVLEKSFAQQAGLGAVGMHTLLVNDRLGSFLFLGEILTDAELAFDEPYQKDLCGECRKCMEACPTGALVEARVLDARRCISYRTQRKEPLPSEGDALHGMLWGCDRCQKACPYNEKTPPGRCGEFQPLPGILGLSGEQILSTDAGSVASLIEPTAMAGAFPLLRRNAETILSRENLP